MLKKRIAVIALWTSILVLSLSIANAAIAKTTPLANLDLSEEQVAGLNKIIEEYRAEQNKILIEVYTQSTALGKELKKTDRFETKAKEEASVQKANQLVREIGKLQGRLLKTTVSYLLKAKRILTKEQREQLIANMIDLEIDAPDESLLYFVESDLLEFDLDLSADQTRKILTYRKEMEIKELQIELDIAFTLLNLKLELVQTDSRAEKIDKAAMEISNLAAQIIDNRIDHFLKTKDVLTTDQKKKLLNVLLLTS